MFILVNGDDTGFNVLITELSLTGNQLYESMAANKIHWLTADPAETSSVRDEYDTVALQQQRLRVFRVSYSVSQV